MPDTSVDIDRKAALLLGRLRDIEQELAQLAAGHRDAADCAGGHGCPVCQARERLERPRDAPAAVPDARMEILDALPAHVAVLDPLGRVAWVNKAWRAFAACNGLPGGEAGVGSNYLDTCASATGPDAQAAAEAGAGIRRVLRGQLSEFSLEYPCHSPTEDRWFHLLVIPWRAGDSLGAVVMHVSIARRKVAERALHASLKELADLKAALDEHAIVAITDRAGRIFYVNEKFCQISKYGPQELIGQDHRIISSGHHPSEFFRQLWATISGGQVWKGEIRNRAKDGSFYWVDTTIVPFLDEHGRPFQYVAIRADITERKRMEEELLASHEQRYRELEAFSYSVSHDLRAPLAAIDGFSRVLQENVADKLGERGRHALNRIRAGAGQMAELIEGLLGLAQLSRGRLAPRVVDLSALAAEVVADLRDSAPRRHVEIELELEPGLRVRGDPRLLKQLLANLLGNAWKFTSGLEIARIVLGSEVDQDGRTVFFVRDNGAGFDMKYAAKLFHVFQRLHTAAEFPGTGIGLATVQRIVERHQGRVWAVSAPGEGATFYFTLGDPGMGRG